MARMLAAAAFQAKTLRAKKTRLRLPARAERLGERRANAARRWPRANPRSRRCVCRAPLPFHTARTPCGPLHSSWTAPLPLDVAPRLPAVTAWTRVLARSRAKAGAPRSGSLACADARFALG